MDSSSSPRLTRFSRASCDDDEGAMEQLMPLVYEEPRRKARGFIWLENQGRGLAALDQALETLARKEPRKAKVVELRFFGGLSSKETTEALKIPEETLGRRWNFANAWLAHEFR